MSFFFKLEQTIYIAVFFYWLNFKKKTRNGKSHVMKKKGWRL